ncbi:MAG TPA: SDR family NAD(P)-dependent oxidoreductase, partial [Vicinamibacterales bacterium]
MQLHDRAVLITGGKRIGAAVAQALASRGMDVALSYNRSKTEADAAAKAIADAGRRVFLFQADLSRGDECRTLVDNAAASLGRLDALVNMASVYSSVPLDDTDEALWNTVVNVDLKAAFLCAHAAIPHL